MNEKTKKILMPSYMQSFKCIGPNCEDSCCIGWNIEVDIKTYKKLKKVTDPQLKKLIKKYIIPITTSQNPTTSTEINLKNDFSCPFLTDKKLCLIQLKKNETYLPNICFTYPRIFNKIDEKIQKSCILSCAEAARLALLNPNGITFIETEEDCETRNMFRGLVDKKYLQNIDTPGKYFYELRDFTIRILQNRNYALWERMVIVGLFYNDIMRAYENKIIYDIPKLITLYYDSINKNSFKGNFSIIPSSSIIQIELLMFVTSKRISQGILNQRYLECFIEFLKGINYDSNSTFEEMTRNYNHAYEHYYKPFMNDYEYILENFLVNYIFTNLFPLNSTKTVFEEYIMLALHYSLIKMHLIGISGFYKELNTDIVIKLIQSYSKAVEHNFKYLNDMFNLLKQKGYISMGYITLWLKN